MRNKIIISGLLTLSIALISATIDLNNLFDYENQNTPNYLYQDNTTTGNNITNRGATLGRVLFYDKKLSSNNSIACASCHHQEFAFGDTALVSSGINGVTARHSMRLVNARYSNEVHAFWDERAATIEDQATMPIRDHIEMGYSGTNGDPNINDLIAKLDTIGYYNTLFEFAYGDSVITEERIQKAIAQFVRSIESYDSKFDSGLVQVANSSVDFPNFTTQENEGKTLFIMDPPAGGAGCDRCHTGMEFAMVNNSANNGVLGVANDTTARDTTITKAPTLRDLVNPQGMLNGPLMHDGSLKTLMDVINHYNDLVEIPNTNLDFRLKGTMHDINLTQSQKEAIVAFLMTLTGSNVYTDEKWSNPFDAQGNLEVTEFIGAFISKNSSSFEVEIFPNPIQDNLYINTLQEGNYLLSVYNLQGALIRSISFYGNLTEDLSELESGMYVFEIRDTKTREYQIQKLIKL